MAQRPEPRTAGAGRAVDLDRFVAVVAALPEFADYTPAAQRVLGAAAALFHRDGAVATTIRDVTGLCGLSPGALYKHFPSKDDVLWTLVRHGHERMDRRLAAAVADAGTDPRSRLRAFVCAYTAGNVEHPEFAQVVRREYVHLSPPRYAEIVERRRAVRATLTTVLRSGHRRGAWSLLGREAGATRQAVMVLDMCSGANTWFSPVGPTTVEVLVERYADAVLRLVGATGEPSAGRVTPPAAATARATPRARR